MGIQPRCRSECKTRCIPVVYRPHRGFLDYCETQISKLNALSKSLTDTKGAFEREERKVYIRPISLHQFQNHQQQQLQSTIIITIFHSTTPPTKTPPKNPKSINMFSKAILFFSVLSIAMAAPGSKTTAPGTFSVEDQSCGDGQQVSCCDSDTAGSLLGLTCVVPICEYSSSQPSLPSFSNTWNLVNACAQGNSAACCKTEQTVRRLSTPLYYSHQRLTVSQGLINVGLDCIPIAL